MYEKGTIIRGPKWAEPIEVISFTEEAGIGYLAQVKGRRTNRFYEDYILTEELDQLIVSDVIQDQLDNDTIVDLLQYYLIKQDMSYADHQSRGNQNVMPLPHQIEAVYSKMMRTPSVRFLLADDPGAGKTIMSGMLVSELLARATAKRILVLVPPLVLTQWQAELQSKFGEPFTIVNKALLSISSGNPFETHDKIICSLYWAMRDEIKSSILATEFDLVIVDEAHKMAAYTQSSKKKRSIRKTKLFRLGEEVAQKTEHLLLLTATPHKGDRENYRHLLSLLDEDLFNPYVGANELEATARPFVIRRLKESMVQFDGTPLFPKRTTHTLAFNLSGAEIELYNAVTDYVREHFNRAKREENRSTTFAMMLLQRRLSSSIEAIYLSLLRRRDRLRTIAEAEAKRLEQSFVDEDELSLEEAERMEEEMLGASTSYDPYELQVEIDQLSQLIELTERIRADDIEYKYAELERTLFGPNGLIAGGEKLLIFTESKDTLNYLQRRLTERIGVIAIIEGSMNMEKRAQAVELFRNEVPVMIATDAGGESINLQFCNQMINYDIPWNPNRLEQRMGRIHRIGQKNEVFVFNLVAVNTREGVVLDKLLGKLEAMRTDLGSDLVYNFLGDVLEAYDLRLEDLMAESIENREHLDEVIAKMDKVLSEEHAELIELAKQERVADKVDLPGVRKSFNDMQLRALPQRAYSRFLRRELEKEGMSPTERIKQVFRISYVPRSVTQKAKSLGLHLPKQDEWLLTTDRKRATSEIALITAGHPLVTLLLTKAEEERLANRFTSYSVNLQTPEPLEVIVFSYGLRDGNDRVVSNQLKVLGLRQSGETVELSAHWLYSIDLEFTESPPLPERLLQEAKKFAINEQRDLRRTRELQAIEKEERLNQAFEVRLKELKSRLQEFIDEGDAARNSANINRYESNIREQEVRRERRLEQVQREGAISLQKIETVIEFRAKQTDSWRCFPSDIASVISYYEEQEGRLARVQPAFGLVDFVSEGEEYQRFILVVSKLPKSFTNLEDYMDIIEETYIYVVNGYLIEQVVKLKEYMK
ncbi:MULTISPECIES: DEAD/DEAH box helicase [Saccharibacillus]|uniref:DEAD/DEAH box helicase n=1 Tax=Saccharibacillus TaxID=456492 RepID=UPI00123A5C32|nr:helicase-related protein [Saccharibacillus sp. WB 17]MWJ31307.1 DEAD/DEAH box helicase [Saccharibacillus sp. WB 17]